MMLSSAARRTIAISMIVLSAVLFVVGLLVLPDTLVMQVTASGQTGTQMPKLLGLLLPLGICVVFSAMYLKNDQPKLLLGGVIGLVVFILTFAFNL